MTSTPNTSNPRRKSTTRSNHTKRIKRPTYLPYAEAREFVRSQLLTSRQRYDDWHKANKPKVVPAYPNRVYKEWVSWNDYLGNDNKFVTGSETRQRYQAMRPYEQAALWVHGLKLEQQEDWLQYCRDNPIPDDIPTRPDLVYKEWKGWKHWLGKYQADTIALQQQVIQTRMLIIAHERGFPSNVLIFRTDIGDVATARKVLAGNRFDVVKSYWFTEDNASMVDKIINYHTSAYLGDENHRISRNTNDLLWVLDGQLDSVAY